MSATTETLRAEVSEAFTDINRGICSMREMITPKTQSWAEGAEWASNKLRPLIDRILSTPAAPTPPAVRCFLTSHDNVWVYPPDEKQARFFATDIRKQSMAADNSLESILKLVDATMKEVSAAEARAVISRKLPAGLAEFDRLCGTQPPPAPAAACPAPPKPDPLQEAWLLMANECDKAIEGGGFTCFPDYDWGRLGLCELACVLDGKGIITSKEYGPIKNAIREFAPEKKPGRVYRWTNDTDGYRARAAFCREQAAKLSPPPERCGHVWLNHVCKNPKGHGGYHSDGDEDWQVKPDLCGVQNLEIGSFRCARGAGHDGLHDDYNGARWTS